MKLSQFAALSLLMSSAAMAQESGRRTARATANLASYVSSDDYPAAALLNGEQGTVAFELAVTPQSKVGGCTIRESSGSASLDETTCRMLTERAVFVPAQDESGKPIGDAVTGRIRWQLPEDTDFMPANRVDAAEMIWGACLLGEARRRVPLTAATDAIVSGSFEACQDLEALLKNVLADEGASAADSVIKLGAMRADFRDRMPQMLAQMRAVLAGEEVE